MLLTDDGRLQDAAKERIAEFNNASVETNLGGIRTILNAIASHLDQETIKTIIETAKSMFFSGIDEGLYYKFDLRIWSNRPEVATGPAGFKLGSVRPQIIATTFLSKDRQTLHFSTKILVIREAIRQRPLPTRLPIANIGSQPLGLANIQTLPQLGLGTILTQPRSTLAQLGTQSVDPTQLSSTSPEYIEDELLQGTHEYNILWKATLTQRGKLTRPLLENIEYKGVEWTSTTPTKD